MNENTQHFFSTGRPITKLGDDDLERRGFAKSIAQTVAMWKGNESLVMALYGGWGDGKSSVKGMVVDALKTEVKVPAGEPPIVLEFNPWEWAGQNQLSEVFFAEIGKQLGLEQNPRAKSAGKRMQALGKHLALGASVTKGAGYLASTLEPCSAIVAIALSKGLDESSKLATRAAEALNEQTEREAKSLLTVKAELREELTNLNGNVLILIDDVDRLAADEIRLLFQLIKANSDFPNLIFFLFFQRDIIERALGRTIRTGSGKDYLEKIVQVPLNLPQIQRPLLEGFIRKKLSDLVNRRGLQGAFDWQRFNSMWDSGLVRYFQNLRDVARFFGTFEFHVGVFPSVKEFNAVDLFALEVLRVYDEKLYAFIYEHRDLLFSSGGEEKNRGEPWKLAVEKFCEASRAAHPSEIKAVLSALFPVESHVIKWQSDEMRRRFQRDARVAHPAFFDRHFQLCVPQGDVTQTDLLALKQAVGNRDEFTQQLLKLDEQGLALVTLERLLAYADEFDPKNVEPLAAALYDVADGLIGKYRNGVWDGISARACELIEAHLEKPANARHRFSILKPLFQQTKGVYLPAFHAEEEQRRVHRFEQEDKPLGRKREDRGILENEQLNELKTLCIGRLERAAKEGTLKQHVELKQILQWWLHWGKSDAPKDYFKQLAATTDGLLILLERFLGDRLSDEVHSQFINLLSDRGLSDFEEFMSVDDLKERVGQVSKGKLSRRDGNLCDEFAKLCAEHKRNRSFFATTDKAAESSTLPDATEIEPTPDSADTANT